MSSDFEYGFDFEAAERQFRDQLRRDADAWRHHFERLQEVFAAMENPTLVKRFQEARRTGLVPEVVGFYLVARALEGVAENMDDSPAMRELADRMKAIERAYGLEDDDDWFVDEWPPEYRLLSARYDELMHARTVQVMRDHGEPAIAEIYIHDREEFRRRINVGRDAYLDAIPPYLEE